jgi:2-polyprenyl-3-methyl-5-hydroxy-6-metoxy-1,4-benzoquinol methylase
MAAQDLYYNHFGEQYRSAILDSAEPHLWTTDSKQNGKVYQEMKKRVAHQEMFVDKYFNTSFPVLDIGCGFGRQAFLLAKKGFTVFGIDTSPVFVNIANDLFSQHKFQGTFACIDLMKESLGKTFKNVLLFDVLEHIIPFRRRRFIKKIYAEMDAGGIVIMSLPHEGPGANWKKRIKQFIPYYTNKEEHPFLIPQKRDVERIVKNLFSVEDNLSTTETDYYVLKRL